MATLPEINAYTHDHNFLAASHDENARRTRWATSDVTAWRTCAG